MWGWGRAMGLISVGGRDRELGVNTLYTMPNHLHLLNGKVSLSVDFSLSHHLPICIGVVGVVVRW